jgi:hypothetical protein
MVKFEKDIKFSVLVMRILGNFFDRKVSPGSIVDFKNSTECPTGDETDQQITFMLGKLPGDMIDLVVVFEKARFLLGGLASDHCEFGGETSEETF